MTKKQFAFAKKHNMRFYFVSAADGTNVVKMFKDSIRAAMDYKHNSTDFMDEVMKELENFELDPKYSSKKDDDSDSEKNKADDSWNTVVVH